MQRHEPFKPGDVIDGRYTIEAVIGEGGFATVYRARHAVMGRLAAVKVLRLAGEGDAARAFEARFIQESQAASRVQHPSLAAIYDVGFHEPGRLPWLAMELLEGADLEGQIRRGPMPFDRAQRLLLPVLEALGRVHAQGIVHKDLKPSNLFLVQPGEPNEALKVLDFGVARMDGEGGRQTGTGQVFGTPQYLAPEYIRSHTATPALDVYQLGLVLVELLSGEALFEDSSPLQCLAVHLEGKLELPIALLTSPLGPVLRRALAAEHTERYPDAAALRAALAALDPGAVPTLPPHAPRRALTAPAPNTTPLALGETQELAPVASGRPRTAVESREVISASLNLQPTPAPPAKPTPPAPQPTPPAPRPSSRGWLWVVAILAALGLGAGLAVVLVAVGIFASTTPRPPAPASVEITPPKIKLKPGRTRRGAGSERLVLQEAEPKGAGASETLRPRVAASSALPPWEEYTFNPSNLQDGQPDTSWQPDAKEAKGVGEWVEFTFSSPVTITAVEITNGFHREDRLGDLFEKNGRLRSATLRFDDGSTQRLSFGEHDRGAVRFEIPARSTRRVRLEIEAVWPGARWDDLAVSEVVWWGRDTVSPR